uniref:Uncharacterized protein n=1 Tax=Utricularia reniformis TaxID=192314 RepID=A0A1Y0B2I2_9LAMI|nr:hypothetical protein AEK19_MT1405 [Utricularia reniformis]ART31600.1 hypothetical protein AEK19_MT1405 [Utricularia reniformis]
MKSSHINRTNEPNRTKRKGKEVVYQLKRSRPLRLRKSSERVRHGTVPLDYLILT